MYRTEKTLVIIYKLSFLKLNVVTVHDRYPWYWYPPTTVCPQKVPCIRIYERGSIRAVTQMILLGIGTLMIHCAKPCVTVVS